MTAIALTIAGSFFSGAGIRRPQDFLRARRRWGERDHGADRPEH
jgi:hypothetical protein